MPRRSDAKERMVRSAARLFSVRGVDGTSFADVLEDSGAPRGSIYHHFRDGKSQLAEEAIRWSGEFILAGTAAALERDDPVAAIEALRTQWTDILRGSDFLAGCTIVAAALEGAREPRVRDTAATVFGSWERVLTEAFRRRGVEAQRARSVATLIIAGLEGAVILARAHGTTAPLDRVAGELQSVVELALAG